MVFRLTLSFLFIFTSLVFGQEIKVGLFYGKEPKALVFSVVSGSYDLFSDDREIIKIRTGEIFLVNIDEENNIVLSDSSKTLGRFKELSFFGTGDNNIFQLKSVLPLSVSADYDDNLILIPDYNKIKVINKVNIEKYIPGVIEAEGGSNAGAEYYKAQAVLARTYIYKNMFKHGGEGFNLCNTQHCQAYKGRSMLNFDIYEAVKQTESLILTDTNSNPVIAPYHSNCGGITCKADHVWQNHIEYLKSVNDPFCSLSPNSSWTKSISYSEWQNYLQGNGFSENMIKNVKYPLNNSSRELPYLPENPNLFYKKIREDLGLKSAYFSIRKDGNRIIFNGRGFGHGVGMCQEGAIEMARVGYTYVDILHFYFQDVVIIPYKNTRME